MIYMLQIYYIFSIFAQKLQRIISFMKKLIVLLVLVGFSMAITAQIVAEDFKKDIRRSATNQQAYPVPRQHTLAPAPKGLKPFYISH